MTNDTITKTVFFTVPRDVVWSYLTDKDKLGTWFHRAEADLEQDKDYALMQALDDGTSKKIIWGTVLQYEAPSRLQYSFIITPLIDTPTTVTWTLEDLHGGTRLTMEHHGIGALDEGALNLLTHLDIGWDDHLGRLRAGVKEDLAA